MSDDITLSRDQATEIFKAAHGISELLKALPSKPENAAVMYAVMSKTLRVTPAMEAGFADHVWSIEEIVGFLS